MYKIGVRGYRRRFPSGLRHVSICQRRLHHVQLFTIIVHHVSIRLHAFHRHQVHPVSSLSSATVCLVGQLGHSHNSWIICMPAAPMVIHAGLQALSNAFLDSRILATQPPMANKIKAPIYKSRLIRGALLHNIRTRTRFRRKKCSLRIICMQAGRRRATICIF